MIYCRNKKKNKVYRKNKNSWNNILKYCLQLYLGEIKLYFFDMFERKIKGYYNFFYFCDFRSSENEFQFRKRYLVKVVFMKKLYIFKVLQNLWINMVDLICFYVCFFLKFFYDDSKVFKIV